MKWVRVMGAGEGLVKRRAEVGGDIGVLGERPMRIWNACFSRVNARNLASEKGVELSHNQAMKAVMSSNDVERAWLDNARDHSNQSRDFIRRPRLAADVLTGVWRRNPIRLRCRTHDRRDGH